MINARLFREFTGFADKKSAERRANEIELDIRAGVHGWKSTIPTLRRRSGSSRASSRDELR
jgi:hypothetical protein